MNIIEALSTGMPFQRPRHGETWFDGVRADEHGALCLTLREEDANWRGSLSLASLLATDWQVRNHCGAVVLDACDEDLWKVPAGKFAAAMRLAQYLEEAAAERADEPTTGEGDTETLVAPAPRRTTRKQRTPKRKKGKK